MPVAVVNQDLVHKDLKTLEGAYVKLRQLPFYETLLRRDKGSRAVMEQSGKKNMDSKMVIETASAAIMAKLFHDSIAEHNLTDQNNIPLDFSNAMTLRMLQGPVGQEIERYINELNEEPEDDEDAERFTQPASLSLIPEETEPTTPSVA